MEIALTLKDRQENYFIGDVKEKDVIIYDDMIDSGSTMIRAIEQSKLNGAKRVYAFATHGIFSGNALELL